MKRTRLNHGTRDLAKPKSAVSLAQPRPPLPDKHADLRAFDWKRAILGAVDAAVENARAGHEVGERDVWWALLCEAAQVSRIAYGAPPRQGYPAKSAMPDAPDEISQWQRIAAYLRGELDEMPEVNSRPPQPSAAQITRAEMVLRVWHIAALRNKGERSRVKSAVYLKACGMSDFNVRAGSGLSRQQIHHGKCAAMDDMADFVRGLDNRTNTG